MNVVNLKKITEFSDSDTAYKFYFRANNCIIDQLFAGQLISKVRCTNCGHNSFQYDPFLDLSLPIPAKSGRCDIVQCLSGAFSEEKLDDNYRCDKCKFQRKTIKKTWIGKPPNVLVLHLKRFKTTFSSSKS